MLSGKRVVEEELERLSNIRWTPDTGLPIDTLDEEGLLASTSRSAARKESQRVLAHTSVESVKKVNGKSKSGEPAAVSYKIEEGLEQRLLVPPRDPRNEARQAKRVAPKTAGSKWFDLPAATITPELKRELRLLKLRNVLDPKRHYRAPDSTKFPKHFQIGTVVEGPADFYSARISRRERQQSFGEELLADSTLTRYRKRKNEEIQHQQEAGSKKWYKRQQEKKKPVWARK